MISLEQIKKLEERVLAAVERIRALSAENATLKTNLTRYEQRIDELEKLVSAFKSEQAEIEAGILSALTQLDSLEDSVTEPGAPEPDLPGRPEPSPRPSADEPPETAVEEPSSEGDPAEVTTLNLGADNSADQASPDESARREVPATAEPANPDNEEPELDIF